MSNPLATIGAVTPRTRAAAAEIVTAAAAAGYPLATVWGFAPGDPGINEHSTGRALDLMTFTHTAAGNWIADYAWRHRARLGLIHEIWAQRIRSTDPRYQPGVWVPMSDRGSTTENHYDHVHLFLDDTYQPPQEKEENDMANLTVIAVPGGQALLTPQGVRLATTPDAIRAAWAAGANTVTMTREQLTALMRDLDPAPTSLGVTRTDETLDLVDVGADEVQERILS